MADREIGSFTREQARLLWLDYQERKQLQPHIQHNFPVRREIDEPSQHRMFVKNNSGEEIPAFACMQVDGLQMVGDTGYVKVIKPDASCGEFVFNSQFPIPIGGYGWAYSFGQVRMRGTFSTPFSACDRYQPTSGQWTISKGPGPFVVYGADTAFSGVLRGRIVGESCKAKWIKFYYDPADPPDAENVPIDAFYDGPDPTDCGDVSVAYPLGEPCAAGDVLAFYDPNTDTYQATATPAAMLGEAEEQTFLAAISPLEPYAEEEECGFSYVQTTAKVFCAQSGGAGDVRFNITNQEVITDANVTSAGIVLEKAEIAVCTSVEISSKTLPFTYVDAVKSIDFSGCQLEYTYNNIATLRVAATSGRTTEPELVNVDFVTSVYLGSDGLNIELGSAKVCAIGAGETYTIPATDCVDEYYYPPEECGACEITAETGQSVWQVQDGEWVLVDDSMIPEGTIATPPLIPTPANCECAIGSYVCGDPGGIPSPEENEALWQFRGGEWHLIIDCVAGSASMPTADGEECEYRVTQCNGCCESADPLSGVPSVYITVYPGNPELENVFSVFISLGATNLAASPKERVGTYVLDTADGIYRITIVFTINCEGNWTVAITEANLSTGQVADAFLFGTATVNADCFVESFTYSDDSWLVTSGT